MTVRRRPHRRAFAGAVLLVGVLLAAAWLPLAAPTVDSTGLQWWPPGVTRVGEGFHVRVPVTVTNDGTFPVTNGLVVAEVDVTTLLIEAGWVKESRAGSDLLRSFDLDPNSVRVVEMTNLEPVAHGGTSGRLKAHDTSFPADEARRYEVPSTHAEGFLSGTGERAFDPRTNPQITVLWRVAGTMAPAEERYFVVYFDSLTNAEHGPSGPLDLRQGALLDAAFSSGPGTDLLGFVAPLDSQTGRVTVFGLHDDTAVQVLLADSGGNFQVQQPPTGTHPNPFPLASGEVRDIFISHTTGTAFRLVASRPILALVESEGFVPSPSGGIVGDEFFFATTYRERDGQDSLFILNLDPDRDQTVVRLESLDDGSVQEIHLSDSVNQFPYTVGTHATRPEPQGGECVYPPAPEAPALPPGRGAYRLVVQEGGPVAVQMQPVRGVTPIPSMTGAAFGTEFSSAMARSSATFQDGQCLSATAQYALYAAARGPARVDVFSREAVDPDVPMDGAPVGPAPHEALGGRTFDTGDVADRPVDLQVDTRAWMMVSPTRVASLPDAELRGPLGGTNVGRVFAGFGPTSVFAPYPDTVVEATMEYSASGVVEQTVRLAAQRLTPLPGSGGFDSLLWYTLESNRPIVVLPQGAAPGFLGGVPTLLPATTHPADYRGHLVDIQSATGLDPVSASTVPGRQAEFEFTVTNRGRAAGGGDLPDTIELSHADPPPGWSASLTRSSIRLSTGESETVTLVVEPPDGAKSGQLVPLEVRAESRANRDVFDTADTITHIKREFDVGLWFGNVGGAKTQTVVGSAGETIEYPLVVQNRGSVTDPILVSFTPPEGEWDAVLVHGGQEVSELELELDATEAAAVVLAVSLPEVATEGLLITTVEARSLSSSATLDRVVATSKLRTASQLTLSTEENTVWVRPGQEAVFNLSLRNDGGTAEIVFEAQSDSGDSWSDADVFRRTADTGSRPPLDRISLMRGQEVPIGVAARAAPHAAAGERTSVRFAASSSAAEASLEDFLVGIVLPVHDLEVGTPDGVVPVGRGGETVAIDVTIENRGNLMERLQVAPASVPPGWQVELPAEEVVVPRNGSQTLTIQVTAPQHAASASHDLAFVMTAHDGNQSSFSVPVQVGVFTEQEIGASSRLLAQPGKPVQTSFAFENQGNTPLEVRVEAADGESWDLVSPPPARMVPPGATVVLPVAWLVPDDAPPGESRHRVAFVSHSALSGAEVEREIMEAVVEVGLADLRVADASGFLGAAGWIVHVTIINEGQRAADDVEVVLRVGSEDVDGVTIQRVPVGGAQNVTLLWPEGHAGAPSVIIDPTDRVPEIDETNNAFTVADAEELAATSPGVAWPVWVGLLVGVVVVRRSRRTSSGRRVGPVDG